MGLANSTAVSDLFSTLSSRFLKLYKRKVYVHHYTQFIEQGHFDDTHDNILEMIKTYVELECQHPQKTSMTKYQMVY